LFSIGYCSDALPFFSSRSGRFSNDGSPAPPFSSSFDVSRCPFGPTDLHYNIFFSFSWRPQCFHPRYVFLSSPIGGLLSSLLRPSWVFFRISQRSVFFHRGLFSSSFSFPFDLMRSFFLFDVVPGCFDLLLALSFSIFSRTELHYLIL